MIYTQLIEFRKAQELQSFAKWFLNLESFSLGLREYFFPSLMELSTMQMFLEKSN